MKRKIGEIVAFPSMKAIPVPDLPLKGAAYDKYIEVADRLLNARKLNSYTRQLCEQIAVLHAANARRIEIGLLPSTASMTQIGKLYKELQLVDQTDQSSPTQERSENRFARFGVITRRGAAQAKVQSS